MVVGIIRVLGTLAVVGTLLPLLPTGYWFVRGWDFPRFQLAVLLFALALLALVCRQMFSSSQEPIFWSSILGAACLWQVTHVVQFTPLWRPEVVPAESSDGQFQILVANLDYQNTARDAVSEELRERNATVLFLIEIDEAWRASLESLRNEYAYQHEEVLAEGLGMAVWSKLPLLQSETRFLVEERRPSIWSRIEFGETVINLIGVHPTPPGLRDATGNQRRDSRVRDAELVIIAKEIAKRRTEAWIVAGDFNDVAWSHTTRLFKRLSGLKDPRVGRSFMGTYHADCPVVRFPIDHVFVSDGLSIASLNRHRITGSDHFAVSASLAVSQATTGVTPEPQHDDQSEAEELVEEGVKDAARRDVQSDEAAHQPRS